MRLAAETLAFGDLSSHSELLLFRAAWLAGMTGDGAEALRLAEALVAHPSTSRPAWNARAWNTLGYARSRTSDFVGAQVAYERSVTAARAQGNEALLMPFLNNYAWVLLELDDVAAATTLVNESLSLGAPDTYRWMAAKHTAGVIALRSGDLDLAEEHFTAALRDGSFSCVSTADVLEGLGVVASHRGLVEHTIVLIAAAAAARRSRGTRSEPVWTREVAEVGELAAATAGERRARQARRLGERLDHTGLVEFVTEAERHDDQLTARQQQIADLVVQGLTNPEIALRLGISTGTVRSHVAQMLTRLGLTSRTQLAARTARAR